METSANKKIPLLAPYMVVENAKMAIEFYKKALGAKELDRSEAKDGKRLMHAALLINEAVVMLCDDFPEMRGGQSSTPKAFGGSPMMIHLSVKNADQLWTQAVAAGAIIKMPLENQFWGDRYGQLEDPFGYTWSISSPIA